MPSSLYSNPVPTRPKSDIQPSLFGPERPKEIHRPPDPPNLLIGTSAFTANGWSGSFYPANLKPADQLPFYASHFRTVEIDSTYYGTPAASTVENWYRKTPADFIFAAKIPQLITHERILAGCNAEFDEFISRMAPLKEKLGPLLFQFPKFSKYELKDQTFFDRLRFFLLRATERYNHKFVVEVRNKPWLNAELASLLREYKVALALTDTSFVPRPWEHAKPFDPITAPFVYVRWLGDRKGIESITTTWDKLVVDRSSDLRQWADIFRTISPLIPVYIYANNHYAGNGPLTITLFRQLLLDPKH